MNTKIFVAVLLVVAVVLSACSVPQPPRTTPTTPELQNDQELKSFASFSELQSYLQTQQTSAAKSIDDGMRFADSGSAMPLAASVDFAVAESAGGFATDAGTTNTQYETVDEADFVKNDNKYIYVLQGNTLVIVEGAGAANIVSETEIFGNEDYNNQARELFLEGDILVVLAQTSKEVIRVQKYDIMPQTSYQQETVAYLYDVSDRETPKLLSTIGASGMYQQARLMDGIMYFITQEYPWYGDIIIEPTVWMGDARITPGFHFIDQEEDNYNYNTVVSVDLANQEVVDSETYLLGYANTLMMSENALYIATQENSYWRWYGQEYEEERFYEVIMPLLEGAIGDEVRSIARQRIAEEMRWERIQTALENYFAQVQEWDKDNNKAELASYEAMMETIEEAVAEYDMQKQKENYATIIHKLALDNGELSYEGKGTVPGHLLNQFSMNEYEGNLQVATSIQLWGREFVQYNNVYILDNNMKIVGAIEDIAPGERIYSARFMGDEAYLVTYRQVDPFFVVSLADPKNPFIEGELKLPGYSDYLHPIGNDLVIGVGFETTINEWGGTTREGVKVALFDVSDKKNPTLVDDVVIGDEGSSTPISNDHKAFRYFDGTLVIPVREVQSTGTNRFREWTSVRDVAYVFDVSEEGFETLAEIEHGKEQNDYYAWRGRTTVLRSTYFDNYLYTISGKYVIANDMANDFKEIGSVELPEGEPYRYWW